MRKYKKRFLLPIELTVCVSDEEKEETINWVKDTYGEDSDDLIWVAIKDLLDGKFYDAAIGFEKDHGRGVELIPADDYIEDITDEEEGQ